MFGWQVVILRSGLSFWVALFPTSRQLDDNKGVHMPYVCVCVCVCHSLYMTFSTGEYDGNENKVCAPFANLNLDGARNIG